MVYRSTYNTFFMDLPVPVLLCVSLSLLTANSVDLVPRDGFLFAFFVVATLITDIVLE